MKQASVQFLRVFVLFSVMASSAQAQLLGDWFGDDDEDQATEEQVQPRTQPLTEEEALKSEDPKIYCSVFKKKEVIIDGVKQLRYKVEDTKFLRCLPKQPTVPWVVTKQAWDEQDELKWQEFVQAIGRSKCNSMDTCLNSEVNPYRDETDARGFHYSDCADFPYYMRAYFAFKNNLPFSMVFGYKPNPLTAEQQESVERSRQKAIERGELEKFEKSLSDLRYTRNGNQPVSRMSVPGVSGSRGFFQIVRMIQNNVSTGTFRMFNTRGATPSDFYSPVIDAKSIRPGTVLYNVAGHVALVYEITNDGEVKFVDAHPDNSVTRGRFNNDYTRSNPYQGGGFKNWRPLALTDVKRSSDGVIKTAKTRLAPDSEIADYSAEQYFGNIPDASWDWSKGKFGVDGWAVSYHEYVKLRVTGGAYRLKPVEEFRRDLTSLCTDLQDRRESVNKAIENLVHRKDHPNTLPRNIYGAEGEWESYSSPGRDLRSRRRALDLIQNAKEYMKKWITKDPFIEYQGGNLKEDLLHVYNEVDASCRISYKNSKGAEVRMSLGTALARIARLSFDPYFCPERRWGATNAAELRSCADDVEKADWYTYTQFLRNHTSRDPSEVMGFSLDDVKRISKTQAAEAKDSSGRFNIKKALMGL